MKELHELPLADIDDSIEAIELVTKELPVDQEEATELPELPTPEDPAIEMTELEKLIAKRTGFWQVSMEPNDVKWVRNMCQGKFEITGPNEAFMLMNCYLGFSGALSRFEQSKDSKEPVVLQASAIEACAMLINRHKTSGIESAQRIFRIAMSLNTVIMEMKNLDQVISGLREEERKASNAIYPVEKVQ